MLLYSHCCNHTRNIYQLCVSAQFNLVNEVKKMFIAADEMRWSPVRKSLALTLYMEISQSKCEQQEDPPPSPPPPESRLVVDGDSCETDGLIKP